MAERLTHDFDWIVIGSGFGGSTSALRLAEKGYSVGVLEAGSRFEDDEFAKSTWDLKRYFFAPKLGLRGIMRLSLFKHVTIVSGSGVGGGSLGFANTLYVPPKAFFEDQQWSGLSESWEQELAAHYAEAERMLGVVTYDQDDPADQVLKALGEHLGVADTYRKTRVGVFLGEEGRTVPDPYFGGEGPARTGCIRCARCMVGCPVGAKNTLRKNYLWFAEKLGVKVMAEREVMDIRPIGAADGTEGYEITTQRSGAWLRKEPKTFTARGVVVAAGALGTNKLLQNCRLVGGLPKISPRLGELVRTNSEAVVAVTLPEGAIGDQTRRVAITSSIYPDAYTHIETCHYGEGGDAMGMMYTVLVGDGTKVTRPLKWLAAVVRHPVKALRTLNPRGWSRNTIILLVMQTLDNAIALRPVKTRSGRIRLQTEQDQSKPSPTFIPVANKAAEWIANEYGGIAGSSVMEALGNTPTTAHILGGAVIADSPERGVVDSRQRVFGYENLLLCDGSVVPANVGVNPSLTITALAERAMSHIPPAPERGIQVRQSGTAPVPASS
ncbi:MAG: glucose-methanol-choline oxidoreductase [Solirubrobacterales bacterium]|jgi:cholesterol oxidase|nr:glucose-methanol-choline oxidoreductase [Solirubrobacterales bacterium]